jgi:hypothetical protein
MGNTCLQNLIRMLVKGYAHIGGAHVVNSQRDKPLPTFRRHNVIELCS